MQRNCVISILFLYCFQLGKCMCVAVLTVMWCRCGGSECEWSDGHKSVSNTQPTCQHWHLASVTTCHICQWHRTCSSSFYKCRFCFIVLIEVRKVILVVTFLIVLIVTFLFWSLCFAAFHNQASGLFFFVFWQLIFWDLCLFYDKPNRCSSACRNCTLAPNIPCGLSVLTDNYPR